MFYIFHCQLLFSIIERERFVVKKKQHKHQQLQTFVSDNFDKPYKMSAEKLMNIAEEDKAKALVKIIL